MKPHPRSQTFYWKCDRPAAFHGTEETRLDETRLAAQLADVLHKQFPGRVDQITVAASQGNHRTFTARIDGTTRFVRIEDGPEGDDYIEVESALLNRLGALGLPSPHVYAVDASRRNAPFAWQVMDLLPFRDLNHFYKAGTLRLGDVAETIGRDAARWQVLEVGGFGPFDPAALRDSGSLRGFHTRYADYFHLHLERHLGFLAEREFLSREEVAAMRREIERHAGLLDLPSACLVHKDLALWNVLGTADRVAAYIDWDDAIGGDPVDDLSLLGCFHDAETLRRAVTGYEQVRPLPSEFQRRFWLHLLRNLLMKSVIRVGAGYFDRGSTFFLTGGGSGGGDLRQFTLDRLRTALAGLRDDLPLDSL
jgi:fructosamine-3-kinase